MEIGDLEILIILCIPIALDAKANNIQLNVDLGKWSVEIRDNGGGISGDDVKMIGHRYG
jgi:DNA mismatch repair ATPase MutL